MNHGQILPQRVHVQYLEARLFCIVAAKWSKKWKTHVYANMSFLEQDIFPFPSNESPTRVERFKGGFACVVIIAGAFPTLDDSVHVYQT